MHYFSLDIETTGLDPEMDQILEIGVVVDTQHGRKTLRLVANLPRITGDVRALVLNSELIEDIARLRETGLTNSTEDDKVVFVPPQQFIGEFFEWLTEIGCSGQRILLAGKNIGAFDIQFIKKLPDWDLLRKCVGHRYLDIGTLYYSPFDDGVRLPDLKTCCERAGVDRVDPHTGLGDAEDVLNCLRSHYG